MEPRGAPSRKHRLATPFSDFVLPGETMKRALSLFVLVALIPANTAVAQTPIQTHQQRVVQGLVSPVLVKGDPGWSLQERMKHYKVPGVSIAVIKDYKVEWAAGYGVKDLDTKEPVTIETLFQAGSISKPVAAM